MAFSRSKGFMWGGILIVLIVAGCGLYTWITLNWSFSSGERAGYVQKFSHKGWLCKTWEGELQMIPVPGSIPEKFLFSVRDDAIAQKINASMGKRVSLHYEQHKGVPTQCFGETEYYVTNVISVGE
ncbi:hypothetical protein [Pelotalea chapellei]|uniref:6-phosphogluconate dehydrogenase n=1 Tax=Pelotalea chapellei TaxID=44671 RepID=A0ABS5UAH5_9BACT|nr:hypothetical protein [Pelotalea chapellei]MBT1072665.1 hypothetical protein [Pelotalea chapellei]